LANGNDQTTNPTDDMTQSVKNQGKKAGQAVVNKGKQVAGKAIKKVAKEVGKKIAKAAIKLAMKLIAKVIALLAPYAIPILIVVGIAVLGYYVLFEIRGTEQVYVHEKVAENETKKDAEKGYDKTDASSTSGQTQAIQTYYKYMSERSYWQIITDDNEKLELPQDTGVMDYYSKERDYYLNSNLLFALDETMHKKKFIYPEQFVKPVYYDPDKLVLKNLTDKDGKVIVESEEYNKDGDKTGEKVKNVADYGIGSIFKYKKDKKTVTVEGTMYKKDVWNAELNKKETIEVNEPFSYVQDGYPQDIWLMTKAVTFVGEFEFKYENKKTKKGELADNDQPGANNEAVKKVKVGEGKQMKTEYYYVTEWYTDTETYTATETNDEGEKVTVEKTRDVLKSKQVKKSRQVFDKWVPLYGYRKGGVYEEIPVEKETKPTDKGQKYLRDFLYNYEIYIPKSVMGEFNLEARGVTSGGFNMADINMEAGSGVGSQQFELALKQFPIIQNYASMYGVDPYLVLAKATQESAGKTDIPDGFMQITGDGARSISAKNVQTGKTDTYTVYTEADRRDPEKAIRWGVMYFASLIEKMDGDPLKALQSYNFGEGGVLYIKKNHPDDWANGTEWMKWREESRLHYGGSGSRSASYHCIPDKTKTSGSLYGDSCYVENVMKYYAGSGVSADGSGEKEDSGNIFKDLWNNMKQAFNALVADYSKETKFYEYKRLVSVRDVDWALRFATAMEKYVLFSETDNDKEDLNFWEAGYTDSLTGGGDVANYVATAEVAGFANPVNLPNVASLITSLPGWRTDPVYGDRRHHGGTDVGIPKNTPIYATADGTVSVTHTGETYNNGAGLGNYVQLDHADGFISQYGHLTSVSVKKGDTVKKGQLVGMSGSTGKSTGYHLHFTIKHNGVLMDTSQIIKGEQGKLRPAPM
jgi:murein DD-endopeptidase MepM/ murein hydrolase activator NlpD